MGLWEGDRFRCGEENGTIMVGLDPLEEEEGRSLDPGKATQAHSEKAIVTSQEDGLPQEPNLLAP